MNKLAVLVVGGEPYTRLIIETTRKQNDAWCAMEFSDSLDNALDLLPRNSFEIVIMDSDSIEAPCLEAVRRIVSTAPDSALVVVSEADGKDPLASRCVHYGAQDYIEKQNLSPLLLSKSIVYAVDRKNRLLEKEELIADLDGALKMIDKLQCLLPQCICCKKLYDGSDGHWYDIDTQFHKATRKKDPLICPECSDKIGDPQH